MSRFIIAGYRLTIQPIFKDVTTLGDDPAIDFKPESREVNADIYDREGAMRVVEKFFSP
jgi:hypothetical protein